ncbi:prefoldin subunit 2-like [Anneissia japonica]|uniref:prefoldin subunit 2-like n=1 Tax=Anneissia japonica TaxID=1529436 RepID=UPI001425B6A7|nr:prefoldin subunit 2-like [Anneissia japonica]
MPTKPYAIWQRIIMADKGKSVPNSASKKTNEQIVHEFNQLRQEQRALASKMNELEAEANEHSLVIKTLDGVDGERRCFRMVGGVLVERTVKDVLPALKHNKEGLIKLLENLKLQLEIKGKELQAYREKHNIRIRGEETEEKEKETTKAAGSQSVLVGKGT